MLNKIFIPFEDGCLLFDEIKQSVLILNQTATFIWCASFETDSDADLIALVASHFSVPTEIARQDIEQFYNDFETNCQFLPVEDTINSFLKSIDSASCHSSDSNVDAMYLSLNQNAFKLVLPTLSLKTELQHVLNKEPQRVLNKELLRIYSHFICSSEGFEQSKNKYTIEICLNTQLETPLFSIYINEECVIKNLFSEGVVPYLFGIIFETTWKSEIDGYAIEMRSRNLLFHAAVLSHDKGGTVLFPAESGAGKSTLAAVLAAKGWHFFTDELAIIRPDAFAVSSCPLPVCVKDGAVDFLSAYYPQLSTFSRHHRLDDKNVRYLPVEKPVLASASREKINAIIFPRYDREINCELQTLNKTEALTRFLNCGSSGRPLNTEELSSVVKMIEKLPCYYLNYSDIDKAITQIESVIVLSL